MGRSFPDTGQLPVPARLNRISGYGIPGAAQLPGLLPRCCPEVRCRAAAGTDFLGQSLLRTSVEFDAIWRVDPDVYVTPESPVISSLAVSMTTSQEMPYVDSGSRT